MATVLFNSQTFLLLQYSTAQYSLGFCLSLKLNMQTTFICCELHDCICYLAGPTMKIQRHVVHKKYAATIEAMYSES